MGDAIHVEVAWETDPLTRPADEDWTRLGTVDSLLKVQALTTSRGVNIRTGDIETGTATAKIADPSGNLDPSNAGSEWAPNVLPRRRIRFVVDPGVDGLYWGGEQLTWGDEPLTWDGGDETVLWTGFVNSLPIQWRTEVQWTTLTAAGIFWLLSDMHLPPSVLHVETVNSEPVGYWPMTESVGQIGDDVVGVNDGTFRRPVVETAQLMPFDTRGSVVMRRPSTADEVGQSLRITPWATGSELSVSVWWASEPISSVVIPSVMILSTDTAGIGTAGRILLTVQGQQSTLAPDGDALGLYAFDGSNPMGGALASIKPLFDGAPHHFVLTLTDAGDFELYIDGVQAPTIEAPTWDPISGVDLATLMPACTTLQWGWGITNSSPLDSPATLGHASVWDRILTADEVSAIYEAGVNPWAGDLTGARLDRILDLAGVDADDRDIATGTQTCGPTVLDGASVMDYIRTIAATEGGPIGEDAEGRIFLRDRTANSPESVATFSDDPAGDSGSAVAPLDPDFSLDRVVNIARVTRENGGTQVATAPASETTYGPKTISLTTLHQSPSGARSTASRLTIRNHDPRLVFPSVVADRIDTPAGVMTGTDIGDAVDVIARPPRGGDPIEQTSIVERVEHMLSGGASWKTKFGVVEHTVLPDFWWDEPGQGWDESVWVAP